MKLNDMKYKDKNLSPEERAQDLLSRMTLEEKFQQITFNRNVNWTYDELLEKGEFTVRYGTFSLAKDPDVIDKLQDFAMNQTRLGIPLLVNWEGIHGVINASDLSNNPHFTAFPQCLGLGCTFNREYVHEMASCIGKEARAYGIRQLYAPNIDIPRDPRWGRTQENYGEDTYLAGEMGVAYVKGLQAQEVAATAKHFIAYGVPEGGVNIAPSHIGEREIREVMLEPFKKCIDAGVLSVMPSYNEVDGEPLHASVKYMRDVLRDELGFNGVTVSDYDGIRMLFDCHYVAENPVEAGKMALKAGVDVEAPTPIGYCDALQTAIANGEFDEGLVDEAVLRILTLKFKLGLFENPYSQRDTLDEAYFEQARELARKMDEEGIVLLENDGILPLDENKAGKVAVIGNNAKKSFLGNYTEGSRYTVDFYQGMKNRLGEDRVLYARGCNPITVDDTLIEEAVKTASQADTIFLVLGDNTNVGGGVAGIDDSGTEKRELTDGEGYDVHDLDLFPSQKRLFDAITALGKPTILVLYAGRPYTLMNEVQHVNAYMHTFGGGEQTGTAMANLIFGDKSPSGKLAISFPQHVGNIPCHYNYKGSARGFYKQPGTPDRPGRDYVTAAPKPWYPFGYGLSYTKLEYSNLKAEVCSDDEIRVLVEIENQGSYDINESVLLFVRTMVSPVTPFLKKLRAFEKVFIPANEKKTVEFVLTREDFTYIDFDYKVAYASGRQRIMIQDLMCEIVL